MAMKKENSVFAVYEAPANRITRARAAACSVSGSVLALKPPLAKSDMKPGQRGKKKRDENSYAAPTAAFQHKKRAVLRDVTNVCCENSFKGCINVTKIQAKVSQRIKLGLSKAKLCSDKKVSNPAPAISVGSALILENKKDEQIKEVVMSESQDTDLSLNVKENLSATQHVESLMDGESTCDTALFEKHTLREGPEILCQTKHVKDDFCKNLGGLSELDYIDIDSDHSNPQMCCLYSSDIYTNLRAAELLRRPCSNFMETVQRDITHSMRGILIDWLVEVSDEYKLVPDTLYLTVNIIDRFLSQNYIERQRLQLLGITCMLIASKYEEICAPRVEEFCFITDNTYTKGEVPPQALSHLANYLAELTLVEYSFLKFLPSVIAASAVFLARWTLEQFDHPWNRTLEHYTCYKASELKETVLEMHELYMNLNGSPLNAIREKYRQSKFEGVAAMTSPNLLQSLFC